MENRFIILCKDTDEYNHIKAKVLPESINIDWYRKKLLVQWIENRENGNTYCTDNDKTILFIDKSSMKSIGKNYTNENVLVSEVHQEFISAIIKLLKWEDACIYVSIHPGGGTPEKIKNKLQSINLKNKERNILYTYHGSQNSAVETCKSIDDLKKALKNFIQLEIEKEMEENNEKVLLQKKLLDNLFNETGEINQALFKNIFTIELSKKIKGILINYRDSLEKVNRHFNELVSILSNTKE